MKKKSIQRNAILNTIKTLSSLLFPLLTYKYAANVLGVSNMGSIDFANSIVTYLLLLAALGIKTYAVREGSIYRENKLKYERFCNEIFSINIWTMIISYLILLLILLFPFFSSYRSVILILSLSIFFTTIGVEWIFSIWEDYGYITVRSIIFQLISFLLLLLFVKDTSDYYIYVAIIVLSNVGSNILNYLFARKYMKFRFVRKLNLGAHLKPLLIFFASSLATTIYVSSDITLLGFLAGDYYTGLYSSATKVYSIIKKLLAAILIVAIPRLSFYVNNGREKEYNDTLQNIANTLLVFLLPSMVGLYFLSEEIIWIVAGDEFLLATKSLKILSLALIFCIIAWYLSQCVLVPLKKENFVFKITILSAFINIIGNFFLIPIFKHNAAALTTVLSEATVAIIYLFKSKPYIQLKNIKLNLLQSIYGCIGISLTIITLKSFIELRLIFIFISITMSVIVYFLILIILKNEIIWDIIKKIRKRFVRGE